MKKKNKSDHIEEVIIPCERNPLTPTDLINKYGTYEVGSTCDTENEFPQIGQGIPKNKNK